MSAQSNDDLGGHESHGGRSDLDSSLLNQLSHGARERILAKGHGWCAFTHKHDNSHATMAAACETVRIAMEILHRAVVITGAPPIEYTHEGLTHAEEILDRFLTALLAEGRS